MYELTYECDLSQKNRKKKLPCTQKHPFKFLSFPVQKAINNRQSDVKIIVLQASLFSCVALTHSGLFFKAAVGNQDKNNAIDSKSNILVTTTKCLKFERKKAVLVQHKV